MPKFSYYDSYEHYQSSPLLRDLAIRHQIERGLGETHPGNHLDIFCTNCKILCAAPFIPAATPDDAPNWRESLACTQCQLISRVRFGIDLLRKHGLNASSALYLTEQTTPAYATLLQHFPKLIGSEYLEGRDKDLPKLQTYLRHLTNSSRIKLRHEDVTALSIKSGSQQGVFTMDVLEHVPNYRAALAEFYRVLANNGTLLITVPFNISAQETLVRARLVDGQIEHLTTPEYHGDPVNDAGCLAFYTFGWDLLDTLREIGFSNASLADGWSPAQGYLGFMGAIVARK